ncbi:hypothetical protein [Bartonella rattaustraliani]|uniref:hypothetical protein n=1 Tax=Bartonella rattaustraliani TaxID=481139 RepID=UPI00030684BA|nr:hypothetical protein [Bartonella rattaustraliani]
MRVTSIILIFIGVIGIIKPELFIEQKSGGGRWVFIVIFLLGFLKLWPIIKQIGRYDDDH